MLYSSEIAFETVMVLSPIIAEEINNKKLWNDL